MAVDRKARGDSAEDIVLAEAKKRGWRFIERNYRTRRGELDLVFADTDTLVIIEVRMRTHPGYGSAIASVDARKQRRIIAATRRFLCEHPRWANAPLRFDVVGLDASGITDWVENAFLSET